MASQKHSNDDFDSGAPLGGTRSQAIQRLQVGLSLLAGVILMIGLANVVENRAKETEAASVAAAAATVPASPTPSPTSDPLVDAGVVPDLPVEPTPTATSEKPILPEQGDVAPPQ